MITLDGYDVLDVLAENDTRALLRLRPTGGGDSVVVKLLTAEHPPPADVARLRHECAVTEALPDEAVVRPLRVEQFGRRTGLVCADTGGLSLSAAIPPGGMELGPALRVGCSLARALGRLHGADVIHRDVNPANVVVDAELTTARLTDFGIATRLPRLVPDATAQERLEGTLAYMAPEQTGRMNRSVDDRADVYALGVTLYQMLTGRLPFEADDPLELVHNHLAVVPPPPAERRPAVPPALSAIVMKALAKAPEDRYQSAEGLLADLDRCLQAWRETSSVPDLEPGAHDRPTRFVVPERLYGRDGEIAALTATVAAVAEGGRALALLRGPAGIGKTAVVAELAPVLARYRFLSVSGKFDQFSADVPYASVITALRGLLRRVLAETPAQVAAWRERIVAALGGNLGVVADVLPDLRLVVGEVPPAATVGPAENQNRFTLVFRAFLGLFARPEQPLAIFLDDLHWADPASLRLLAALLDDPDLRHLLLIGAYRAGEVSSSHPLAVALDGLDTVLVRRFDVGPLGAPHVAELVAEALRHPVPDLADYLHDRTGGNPFFLRQVLTSLAEDGLLRPGPDGWTCDPDEIRAHGLPDDVVGFMVDRIAGLPVETRRVLQLASLVGNQFDLDTLAALLRRPAAAVSGPLWSAIQAGLVLPVAGDHELVHVGHTDATVAYRFLHDRIQQAGHSTIPAEDLPRLHLKVGRILQERSPGDEDLFEIVGHLNAASDLVPDGEGRLELARLNVRAAARASASTAFATAEGLLSAAAGLLGPDPWDASYDTAVELHLLRGQALGMLGRVEEADATLSRAGEAARTDADFLDACEVRAEMLYCAGHPAKSYAVARAGLTRLGVDLPSAREEFEARTKAALADLLQPDLPGRLRALPDGDARTAQIARLFGRASTAALFAAPGEVPLLGCLATQHALRNGLTPAATMPIGILAMAGVHVRAMDLSAAVSEAVMELTDRVGDPVDQLRARAVVWTMVSAWYAAPDDCDRVLSDLFLTAQAAGDLQFASHALVIQWLFAVIHGRDCADMLDRTRRWLDHARQFLPAHIDLGLAVTSWTARLAGVPAEGDTVDAVAGRLAEAGAPGLAAQARMGGTFLSGVLGEYALARRYAAEGRPGYAAGAGGTSIWALLYEVGAAVSAARAAGTAGDEAERAACIAEAAALQERIQGYADLPPHKFACYAELVRAEIARAGGDAGTAQGRYLAAADHAQDTRNVLVQGWATELLGRLHLEHGRAWGLGYLDAARELFGSCGAGGKVAQLEREFPGLTPRQHGGGADGVTLTATGTSTTHGGASLDLATVVKAAQAIASETAYDRVVTRLVEISVQNAGAERGCFVPADGADLGYPDIEGYPGEDAPASVIAYVTRTREPIVVDDITRDDAFSRDPYVLSRRPRSVAAGPIVRQGRLLGVLYLENSLLAGAFTADRLELLRLLGAQMAVSLENARIYGRLEDEVAERTRALRASLDDLRAAQARIAESEKLAALGGLVAGVAHEVNTPIGVAVTAASHLLDRTRDFAAAYAAGPLRRSELGRFTATVREAERLINTNLGRATDLVASFKQVAVDQAGETRRTFALCPYLHDIAASLGPVLKRTPHRVEIECGPAPDLDSYPGALAQVITNLVLNSLTHAYPDGAAGVLRLRATCVGEAVRIDYADDGRGIPADVLPRVFEPFFTTSRTGAGSGLGLHIVHTLVTQRLGGKVRVTARPGGGTQVELSIPRAAPAADPPGVAG